MDIVKNLLYLYMNNRKRKDTYNTKRDFIGDRVFATRKRAEEKGWEHNLTREVIEDLLVKQEHKCYYTGIVFNPACKKTSMSIDRRDSRKGYTTDNIVLCCTQVNKMKSNMTMPEMFYFIDRMIEKKIADNQDFTEFDKINI